GGCPILNTAIESDDTHPILRARTEAAMSNLIASLQRIIDKGITRGEIRAEVHSQEVAVVFISTMEGALMLSRLYNERQHITFALHHIEQFIEHSLRR
ncbi:MAG: TetR family transcriptional regulator C-terminal domain-containing protein, partial [Chloroflexota bacterium]